jgi:superfamily II DNA/RNA helicase
MAFVLPLLTRLSRSTTQRQSRRPRALILAPTRELATQIEDALTPLAAPLGLTSRTVFGGVGQNPQVTALRKGVDIVVACPGRLEDLIGQGHVSLDAVEVTIIDEADHMADLGFLPAVRRLLDATPARGQRMLFSATLDAGIGVIVKRYLSNPVTHEADSAQSPVVDHGHHVLHVTPDGHGQVLLDLVAAPGRTVVFTRTKHRAKKLARQLNGQRASPRSSCTATSARTRAPARWRPSTRVQPAPWSPPTSRRAASTSTTSPSSSTPTRRSSTRPTRTARAAPPAPVPPARSSR